MDQRYGSSQLAVILKYAGKDATAAYDEIHAPGIIEEFLSPESFKGLLDQTEVVTLPEDQKKEMKIIEQTRGQSMSNNIYTNPDLYKLISAQDFEDVARNTLTPKAWAFFSSAATDLTTHNANSTFYRRILLRPRVMRNVAEVDTRRSILGCSSSAPFFVSPAAMARLAHPDGETALAKGCAAEGLIQVVSRIEKVCLTDWLNGPRYQTTPPIRSPTLSKQAAMARPSSSNFTSTPIAKKRLSFCIEPENWESKLFLSLSTLMCLVSGKQTSVLPLKTSPPPLVV